MKELTDKQIKARAYYKANAEKIKAQKRDKYKSVRKVSASVTNKKAEKKTIEKTKKNTKRKYKPQSVIAINKGFERNEHIPDYDDRKISVRERIENLRIERELMACCTLREEL